MVKWIGHGDVLQATSEFKSSCMTPQVRSLETLNTKKDYVLLPMKFQIKATLNHGVNRRKFNEVLLFSQKEDCDLEKHTKIHFFAEAFLGLLGAALSGCREQSPSAQWAAPSTNLAPTHPLRSQQELNWLFVAGYGWVTLSLCSSSKNVCKPPCLPPRGHPCARNYPLAQRPTAGTQGGAASQGCPAPHSARDPDPDPDHGTDLS